MSDIEILKGQVRDNEITTFYDRDVALVQRAWREFKPIIPGLYVREIAVSEREYGQPPSTRKIVSWYCLAYQATSQDWIDTVSRTNDLLKKLCEDTLECPVEKVSFRHEQ